MNYLTVYDPVTGEILETHSSPGSIHLVNQEAKSFVEKEADMTRQYVSMGEVVNRPILNATLNGNILSGVPEGASVIIDDMEYEADGSDIELSFSIEAAHKIEIKIWPYMPMELLYEN